MPFGFFHEITGDRPGHDLPVGPPPVVGGGPIIPPPLPGVWPPPGMPNFPIDPGWGHGRPPVDPGYGYGHPLPPHVGGGPIVIPQPPPGINPPIVLPPPGIYPPLPPGTVPPNTMVAILVKVIGSDTCHWIVVDTSLHPGTPLPPSPTPK